MKISGQTKFIAGLFVGHFIISPIADGRVKKLFEQIKQSKKILSDDFEKLNKKNKEYFIEKYGKVKGEEYYQLFSFESSDTYYYRKNNDDDKEKLFEDSKLNSHNRSNQMNPNNNTYWQSRGHSERPDNWEGRGNTIQEYS